MKGSQVLWSNEWMPWNLRERENISVTEWMEMIHVCWIESRNSIWQCCQGHAAVVSSFRTEIHLYEQLFKHSIIPSIRASVCSLLIVPILLGKKILGCSSSLVYQWITGNWRRVLGVGWFHGNKNRQTIQQIDSTHDACDWNSWSAPSHPCML